MSDNGTPMQQAATARRRRMLRVLLIAWIALLVFWVGYLTYSLLRVDVFGIVLSFFWIAFTAWQAKVHPR